VLTAEGARGLRVWESKQAQVLWKEATPSKACVSCATLDFIARKQQEWTASEAEAQRV
jgi:hypothetical protein